MRKHDWGDPRRTPRTTTEAQREPQMPTGEGFELRTFPGQRGGVRHCRPAPNVQQQTLTALKAACSMFEQFRALSSSFLL
eukprot:14768150-Alexandrium_andersonii.AAC.1